MVDAPWRSAFDVFLITLYQQFVHGGTEKRLKHRTEPKQQCTHDVAPLKQQFPFTVLFQSVPALLYGALIPRE